MPGDEQKLPMVVKLLIGFVILLFVLPILTVGPVLFLAIKNGPSNIANELSEWEGRTAPDLAITTTEGATLQLSEFRGRAVILDFWATWCGPCVREIPHLQKVADEFPQDIVVIGISSENMSVLQKFASSKSLRYQVGNAASSSPPYSGITVVPTTFFIDREGTIRKVLRGYQDHSQLNAQASMMLK